MGYNEQRQAQVGPIELDKTPAAILNFYWGFFYAG